MNDGLNRELIESLRRDRVARAPSQARARVAGRLAAVLPGVPTAARAVTDAAGSGQGVETAPNAAHTGTSSFAGSGMASAKALMVAAFVAGGAVGAGLHAKLAPSRSVEKVVYVTAPGPSAPPAPPSNGIPTSLSPTPTPAPAPTPAPTPERPLGSSGRGGC